MFRPLKCSMIIKERKSVQKTILKFYKSTSSREELPGKFDVVIIGAGCMGSLTAFWLKKKARSALNILVIDRDLTYKTASTVLSVGGVRQQFTLKENVQLSCFGADFIQNTKNYIGKSVDIQFKPHGYLTLATENGVSCLEENHKTQVSCGGVNKLLTPFDIKAKFPWLNTDGIKLGCLGQKNEGWMDPWLYLIAMRDAAKELGVRFLEAVPCEFNCQKIKSRQAKTTDGIVSDEQRILSDIIIKTSAGEIKKVNFKTCVIAAGADTGKLTKELLGIDRCNSGTLHYEIPIERRKRYVYFLECPNKDCEFGTPMVIDPTGLYIRKENASNNYICGLSPCKEDEPPTDDLEVDYEFFENKIWVTLAQRIPCFEAVRVKSAWAGFYDYNIFDQNGIVGLHPAYKNMIIAAGFSGHGLQHSAGIGRAVSELLLDGRFQTIDLSSFAFERIIKNEPLIERDII